MTVIAAATDGTRVCMGADSQYTNGGAKFIAARTKLRRMGKILYASDGQLGLESLIEGSDWEPPQAAESLFRWACRYFAPVLRERAVRAGITESRDGFVQVCGVVMLALRSELVKVDPLGGVLPVHGFWAIGSGGAEARGAMHRASGDVTTADMVVRAGLDAACALDDGCSRPFGIEWTNP